MNSRLYSRINGLHKTLLAQYEVTVSGSSATMGYERETFIDRFLSRTLPPHYRLSTGDVVDKYENESGQLDIVLESPNMYSFAVTDKGARLYSAEAVASILEVKSDLPWQWPEIEKKL